jgi:sporulation protein YlmC with PRC-barrel domain
MGVRVTNDQEISSGSLLGLQIKNDQGQELGKVEGFLIKLESGRISNLILSSRGLVKKRVAVPWDMLKVDLETGDVFLNIDKEFLDRIPSYQGER